jgi:hypothetical protein
MCAAPSCSAERQQWCNNGMRRSVFFYTESDNGNNHGFNYGLLKQQTTSGMEHVCC